MAAQTPGRKQWGLTRGPKGNVQSLGWAECGCPELQVKLAKELLGDNGEEGIDKEEKARLGVYWLLRASEKGNEEATQMLKDCLESGTGVNEHNLSDVRSCLAMPKGEKLSREAAKELFVSLSQGENYITSGQLLKEISKFSAGPIATEEDVAEVDWRYYRGGSERLTEEMIVTAGSDHIRGKLPSVIRKQFNRSTLMEGATYLAQLPFVPQPLLAIALIPLFGLTYLLDSLPSIVYYASLLTMVLSTCQILTKKREFDQFRQWSFALVANGCSLDVSSEAQWAHCTQSTKSFLIFTSALFVNIVLSSYVPDLPYSEIATLSTFLSVYMLYNIAWNNKKINKVVLITFVIHLIARYPYESDTFVYYYWKYLDVHVLTFTSYMAGSGVEFFLNIRTILYLMLPGLFLLLAARDRWLGIYKTVLPQLVCMSWWQIAISALSGASYFGLIRSCLGLVFIFIFLPLTSITIVCLPLFAVSKLFVIKQISIPFAIGGICLCLCAYIGTKFKVQRKIFRLFQLFIYVASIFLILNSSEVVSVEKENLDWKEFSQICGGKEDIKNQERCMTLVGLPVSWEGVVVSTKISSVYNPVERLLNYLPEKIQGIAVCLIGKKYDMCNSGNDKNCKVSHKRCRISNWNRYEYEIEVKIGDNFWGDGASTKGWLKGDQNFRNFSIALKTGDRIWFNGLILGWKTSSYYPYINLEEAKCLSCDPTVEHPVEVQRQPLLQLITRKLLTFLLYPIFVTR